MNDDSDRAFEKVVDRLLASPHYGERWGRHWLDVARYADTKDLVLVFGNDAIRPYAYTYRDYVIRALNADVPYDRFIVDQLAADQVDAPAKTGSTQERLAAGGDGIPHAGPPVRLQPQRHVRRPHRHGEPRPLWA